LLLFSHGRGRYALDNFLQRRAEMIAETEEMMLEGDITEYAEQPQTSN
jgi:hypothetical protein